MANVVLYIHTTSDTSGQPFVVTHVYRLADDQSQLVVRRVDDTGQIWPRGAAVRPYSTE